MGIAVHELDPQLPFSAARARKEGVAVLIGTNPSIEYIQFLDADCTLESDWIARAAEELDNDRHVAVVCGELHEVAPHRSIYNKINSLQWKASPGETASCGGVFMIRRSAYSEVGGFNASLLTGEEPELCARIRASGYAVIRVRFAMASHDSDMLHFKDWWKRAVWGGYGDALEHHVLGGEVTTQRRRETRSNLLWGALVPALGLLTLGGVLWSRWFSLGVAALLLAYTALWAKVVGYRIKKGDTRGDSGAYAVFCVIRKVPLAVGFLQYWLGTHRRRVQPDPHTPSNIRITRTKG